VGETCPLCAGPARPSEADAGAGLRRRAADVGSPGRAVALYYSGIASTRGALGFPQSFRDAARAFQVSDTFYAT